MKGLCRSCGGRVGPAARQVGMGACKAGEGSRACCVCEMVGCLAHCQAHAAPPCPSVIRTWLGKAAAGKAGKPAAAAAASSASSLQLLACSSCASKAPLPALSRWADVMAMSGVSSAAESPLPGGARKAAEGVLNRLALPARGRQGCGVWGLVHGVLAFCRRCTNGASWQCHRPSSTIPHHATHRAGRERWASPALSGTLSRQRAPAGRTARHRRPGRLRKRGYRRRGRYCRLVWPPPHPPPLAWHRWWCERVSLKAAAVVPDPGARGGSAQGRRAWPAGPAAGGPAGELPERWQQPAAWRCCGRCSPCRRCVVRGRLACWAQRGCGGHGRGRGAQQVKRRRLAKGRFSRPRSLEQSPHGMQAGLLPHLSCVVLSDAA